MSPKIIEDNYLAMPFVANRANSDEIYFVHRKTVDLMLKLPISWSANSLYQSLYCWRDRQHRLTISTAEIGNLQRLSPRHVTRLISTLVECGLVERTATAKGAVNTYIVHNPQAYKAPASKATTLQEGGH